MPYIHQLLSWPEFAWESGSVAAPLVELRHRQGRLLGQMESLGFDLQQERLVINRMLIDFQGHLTSSKYAKLAKCSNDTALRDIRELLERGILVQNPSGGRSTSYRLGEAERA